jgi:hypothetical protein
VAAVKTSFTDHRHANLRDVLWPCGGLRMPCTFSGARSNSYHSTEYEFADTASCVPHTSDAAHERWRARAMARASDGARERWRARAMARASDGARERWRARAMARASDGARERWRERAMARAREQRAWPPIRLLRTSSPHTQTGSDPSRAGFGRHNAAASDTLHPTRSRVMSGRFPDLPRSVRKSHFIGFS